MAPGRLVTRVVRVSNDGVPTTPPGLRELTAAPLDHAAKKLATDPVDVVGYASTTSAYVVGFDEETTIVARLSALLDTPVAATCASAVLALRVLHIERVALVGAPWFDPELNELGAAYFRSQGFDVVSSASAELSHDPRRIDPDDIQAWASRNVSDEAEGVFIGGNGFRAVRAIEPLETAIDRPVLTSNQVLLWNLLAHAGATAQITGYGRLFAHEPERPEATRI
jgi:maleate isomerase